MTHDIIGYLLDALDPHEQEAIEAEMDQDPELRASIESLRRLTVPLAADDRIDPPAGLAERALDFTRRVRFAAQQADWSEAKPRMRAVDFVVAASLLLIAAVLVFPAIATIRGDQARVLCADQLRSLGVAMAMYADVEGGLLPYVDRDGPMNNAGIFAVLLNSRELISGPRDLLCPSANNAVVMVPEMEEYLQAVRNNPPRAEQLRRYMGGSYGYVLGYEQAGEHHGFVVRGDVQPLASDRPPRISETQFVNSPNHYGRGQNVLYADGSVRWLTSRHFGQDDLFRNRLCEIAAGVAPDDIVIGFSEATPNPGTDL